MWFGWVLFGLGAVICALNLHFSYGRYAWHRLRGGRREDYRHSSGIPLFGSAFLVIGWAIWIRTLHSTALDFVAALLFLVDTGGLHWFIAVMLWQRLRRRS